VQSPAQGSQGHGYLQHVLQAWEAQRMQVKVSQRLLPCLHPTPNHSLRTYILLLVVELSLEIARVAPQIVWV
jgi:hypothetical protein